MTSNFDIPKLNALLHNIFLLARIRVVVFDDQFQEIASAPEYHNEFCKLMRKSPENEDRCRHSDQVACQWCKEHNKLHIYRCHAGLTEMVAPIRHENLIIGYMMFGQLLSHPEWETYWPEVKANCAPYQHLDMRELYHSFLRLRVFTDEEIYALAQIMEACAGYLWLSRLTTLSRDSLSYQIDAFIKQNIGEDLSVLSICQEFGVSKSMLYKISQHIYGTGIQAFIREYRVRTARRLLETTTLSVGDIAAQVGIPNYNYFTKVFKNIVGETPKDYRKQFVLSTSRKMEEEKGPPMYPPNMEKRPSPKDG